MFVATCKYCGRKVRVARPGSIAGVEEIKNDCCFCGKPVYSEDGFEVAEPLEQEEEFDLLSVE